jgi:addiction module RelE/StbE family toxin
MYTILLDDTSNSLKKELQTIKKAGLLPTFKKVVETKIASRPLSGKPLVGNLAGLYRYKLLGDWRIIYKVFATDKQVLILAVRPRGDAYDNPHLLAKRAEQFSNES